MILLRSFHQIVTYEGSAIRIAFYLLQGLWGEIQLEAGCQANQSIFPGA
jgi:hypothetical protein